MLLGDIIKQYREEHQMSLQNFADLIGTSRSYIHMLEKNINPSTNKPISPSIETLKLLANAMNMDLDFLLKQLNEEQNIYLDEEEYKKQFKQESNAFPITDTPINVPVVGKISAGLPVLAVENIEGYEFAPSSYIKTGYEYFYLRVQGNSMNLKFNEGDIVLVQRQDILENDEIGVILVDSMDATVKKYKYENGLVILSPMSTDPQHTVQIYNPKDIEIRIIGKVVSYQGKIN